LDSSKPLIALLPGSRHKEIVRILPAMLETASLMAERTPELQFVVGLASERRLTEVQMLIEQAEKKNLKMPQSLSMVCGQTLEVLNAATAAAVTSGTATLETAIIGTPMVIVYKTSGFNYAALRPLIRVPHFGLINLIAGERLAVELIQNDFTKEHLSSELFGLLDPAKNSQMRRRLKAVVETLGRGGASERAAETIIGFLKRKSAQTENS
jgi:lipid-A-disaccharide synthase